MKVEIKIVVEGDRVKYKQATSPDIGVESLLQIQEAALNLLQVIKDQDKPSPES